MDPASTPPTDRTLSTGGSSVKLTAAAAAAVVLFAVLVCSAVIGVIDGSAPTACDESVGATTNAPSALDGDQISNARTIIQTATRLGMPTRAAIIAVATAWQESGLRNLYHGDRDSLGLFQQRPSTGWGATPASPDDHRTPRQRLLDPVYAATAFYTALRTVPNWPRLPLTQAAQAVQRSARPSAYARWETPTTHLVTTLHPQTCPTGTLVGTEANAAARTAIDYAQAQLGLPYQWGGDGPTHGEDGFDCSGLTHAAYAAAGITLPRTAQAQYDTSPRLPTNAPLQPGDLLFYGTPHHVHHVGLHIGHHQMINAPHTGARVRIEDYRWTDYLGATRPTPR
ncbi:MAG: C40 family peptidase [Angustibacter sp.]